MSVKIITGNIFTTKCNVIVNTINCVGVMGAGIALENRLRYPEMYEKYIRLCKAKKIDIGLLWLYKSSNRWILNFPTKKHWKYPSKKEYLHEGLDKFLKTYQQKKIESIAFPLLGADRGGIDPEESLEIMMSYLDKADIQIEIYKYDPNSKDDLFDSAKAFLLSTDIAQISEVTNLRLESVTTLIEAMCAPEIVQLNQLAKVKGIGIKTLEKIFMLADTANNKNRQQSLFD